jgi:subtilase family serine protease
MILDTVDPLKKVVASVLKHRKILALATAALLATTVAGSALPLSNAVQPRAAARDFGPVNPAQTIAVTVHLKLPNQALFSRTVDALYDPHSPTFRHWLTDAQLRQFAPLAAQLNAVRSELARNGLSVVSIANDGFSIQARGTIAAIERTFHTQIDQFSLNGKSFRANTRPPTLSGEAGAYVSLVSGLESHTVQPALAHAVDPKTKTPLAAVPLSKVLASGGLSSLITDQILGPKQTFTYTTNGGLPNATYTGLVYDPDATRFPDYTPKQLEDVYGLTAAYKQGLNGIGQTIVLLEAYGYPTALADANAFAKLTGLPPLDARNFSIVYPEGVPNPQAGILTGWNVEIAIDIQVAHSIAPGAKILVVATNGQDSQDFEASIQYIIDNHVGHTVSDSWEEDTDIFAGPAEQEAFEDVLIVAAAKGVSFQFSSGDGGDGGLGTPAGAAEVPANAPHATGVGGTSIVNVPNVPGTSSFVPLGWGNDFDYVDLSSPVNPPTQFESFFGGAGGGSSLFWPKPAWQQALPGFFRQTPDVSALADPYTGVPIVVTDPATNTQFVEVGWGGTSVASPIFTAIWAIADQRAGHALGQAAPTVARLKSGVTDVVPLTSSDFSASVTDAKGTTKYSASQLFAPLNFSQKNFLPVVWNQPQFSQALVIAFGADTSLTVTPGWDNVTGYGTPAGLSFINAAASWPR